MSAFSTHISMVPEAFISIDNAMLLQSERIEQQPEFCYLPNRGKEDGQWSGCLDCPIIL